MNPRLARTRNGTRIRPQSKGRQARLGPSLRLISGAVAAAILTLSVPSKATAEGGKDSAPSPPAAAKAVPAIPLSTSAVCMTTFSNSPQGFDDLLKRYEEGPPGKFQEDLGKIATAIGKTPTEPRFCPGPLFTDKDRIAFVFIDDHAVQPLIVRVLQGTAPPPGPASVRLILDDKRCVKGGPKTDSNTGCPLYTVYLFRSTTSAPISSSYAASPSPSPIQGSVNQAITAVAGGVVKLAPAIPTPRVTVTGEKEEACPLTIKDLTGTGWTVDQPGFTGSMEIANGEVPYELVGRPALPPGIEVSLEKGAVRFSGTPTKVGDFQGRIRV